MAGTIRMKDHRVLLVFSIAFSFCLAAGAALSVSRPADAAPPPAAPLPQGEAFAGPESCAECHPSIFETWEETRHAHAFSSPIFQRDWTAVDSDTTCLACHTTGYESATGDYAHEGVTCESCHGPFQSNHPTQNMPVTPDETLCSTCHESTTDEWQASPHAVAGVTCQDCHNPHSQTQKAASVTALCSNCHDFPGESFSHGTHSQAGLECSNCHMFTSPRTTSPIQGLVPTGHTFLVGSDACIGCHQDTVHSRDKIVELTGEVDTLVDLDVEALRQKVVEQDESIAELETTSSARLYLGLAQGAIVGLATGGVAAWIVARRIEFVDIEDEEDGE